MPRKRLSTIPDLPSKLDPQLRRWLSTVKEALDVRLGRRGDPYEAAVTFNDLVDIGLASGYGKLNPVSGLPLLEPGFIGLPGGEPGLPDFGPPPQPTGVTALGVFGGIHVLWDRPLERPDITYTEVYRSADANFANATLIGGNNGASYFDIITAAQAVTYWYWVKHFSITGEEGPLSVAVSATKPANTQYVLNQLSGSISTNEFVQVLNDRINLIDGPQSLPGSVDSRINTAYVDLDGQIASVQTSLQAGINANQGEILSIGAQYTLQLDVNGYLSGYTTYNSGTTSGIVFRVDSFAVGSPGNPNYFPFVIDGGVVYIDTAVIKDGSIESGKIGSITFGQVTAANGTPVTTVGGLLKVDYIDVNSISVTNAMIANASITEAKIANAAVSNAKIANAAITAAKIGNLQVTNAKIANAAITNAKIGNAAVDTLKLAGQAVTFPNGYYVEGQLSVAGTVAVAAIAYTSSGAPVYVHAGARFKANTSVCITWRIRRTNPSSRVLYQAQNWCQTTVLFSAGVRDTLTSTGYRRYALESWRSHGGSGTYSSHRFMFTLETKR